MRKWMASFIAGAVVPTGVFVTLVALDEETSPQGALQSLLDEKDGREVLATMALLGGLSGIAGYGISRFFRR